MSLNAEKHLVVVFNQDGDTELAKEDKAKYKPQLLFLQQQSLNTQISLHMRFTRVTERSAKITALDACKTKMWILIFLLLL